MKLSHFSELVKAFHFDSSTLRDYSLPSWCIFLSISTNGDCCAVECWVKPHLDTPVSCIRVLIWVFAALFQIHFHANVAGKAVKDDQSIWSLAPTWETRMEFMAHDFGLVQSWLSWPFGQRIHWQQDLSMYLSLHLSVSTFQRNKTFQNIH